MDIKLNNQLINLKSAGWNELASQNSSAQWWIDIIDFLKQWADNSSNIENKTSGSTGTPKVISVQKKHMIASAEMTCEYFNLNNKSVGLLCLSANYIAGKMMLVRAIVSGMNLICVPPSQNPVKELSQKIDFTAMVPYQVQYTLETPEKFNLIQNLIIGGGKVSNTLAQSLKVHSVNTFETFGMTETISHIALKEITPNLKKYFQTLKGVNIKQGDQNELIIDAEHLDIKNLKTNDIIELKSKDLFKWKGRLDFIINSGGIKISPEDIEEKIAHLITQKYCIVGIPHKELGDQVVLFIESVSYNTLNLEQKFKTLLPPYHCPKEIRFIERFPITESGKIKRTLLKE